MNAHNDKSRPAGKAGSRRERLPAELCRVNLDAAGIDVGSGSNFVAVPEGRCQQPVREFAAFTADCIVWPIGWRGVGLTGVCNG